jgi:hypothetical protein
MALAGQMQSLAIEMFGRVRATGLLRDDVTFLDVEFMLEFLAGFRLGDASRSAGLRQRYLAVTIRRAAGGTAHAAAQPGSDLAGADRALDQVARREPRPGPSVPGSPRPAGARRRGAGAPGEFLGPDDVRIARVQRQRIQPPAIRPMPPGDPQLLHRGPLRMAPGPREPGERRPGRAFRITAGPPGAHRRLA